MERLIAHLDMDAFFAAVEERNNPQFRGMPIVVGSDPKQGFGRGVVATANYKAREYGIRSAMPIREAWRRSEAARSQGKPPAVFLSGSYRTYSAISKHIMQLIQHHTSLMQQVSVDEAYFDVSGSLSAAVERCQKIKNEIKEQESLTATIGIGPNKLIAKLATDTHKPDGLWAVASTEVSDFIAPLSIRSIPGIGPKTELLLRCHSIQTVQDARQYSVTELENLLGKWGASLYRKVRGQGSVNLTHDAPPKSISEQTTFATDTLDSHYVVTQLFMIIDNVLRYLKQEGFATFRTGTLIVRLADFTTKNRSHTFKQPLNDRALVQRTALRLLLPFFDARENPYHQAIRLIGWRLEKLS
jgi:DNA polymerase IV (DinB-like DNA polymerase)